MTFCEVSVNADVLLFMTRITVSILFEHAHSSTCIVCTRKHLKHVAEENTRLPMYTVGGRVFGGTLKFRAERAM